jgi:hypothetical protein
MPQMARRPFMKNTMGQPAEGVKRTLPGISSLRKVGLDHHAIGQPKVNHYLHFGDYRGRR